MEVRVFTETGVFSQHFHSWLVVIEVQLHKHPKLLNVLGKHQFLSLFLTIYACIQKYLQKGKSSLEF